MTGKMNWEKSNKLKSRQLNLFDENQWRECDRAANWLKAYDEEKSIKKSWSYKKKKFYKKVEDLGPPCRGNYTDWENMRGDNCGYEPDELW